jgi:hypothetical protein
MAEEKKGLEGWFAKCDRTAKDVSKFTKDSSGLRGIVFKALDVVAKEQKGKLILRAACIQYLGTVPEIRAALLKQFEPGELDEAVHRLHMYCGQWQKKRKVKVVGEQGSKQFQF